jgi:hypothetical protein
MAMWPDFARSVAVYVFDDMARATELEANGSLPLGGSYVEEIDSPGLRAVRFDGDGGLCDTAPGNGRRLKFSQPWYSQLWGFPALVARAR